VKKRLQQNWRRLIKRPPKETGQDVEWQTRQPTGWGHTDIPPKRGKHAASNVHKMRAIVVKSPPSVDRDISSAQQGKRSIPHFGQECKGTTAGKKNQGTFTGEKNMAGRRLG